jgi:glyoxylase-like metal-dependent hydrolase (beta-lactamase superfamily II)
MTAMKWSVYALRYAHREALAREHFISAPEPHDAPMAMDYFVWLLRHGDRQILVDTGFSAATAVQRNRVLTRSVGTALRELGSVPETIRDVVITHLHYDHAGNLDLFPRARFHLQDREMAFATGRYMLSPFVRHAFEVDDVVTMVRAVYAERVVYHDGDATLAPGVTLHLAGGHTAGLQMVRVETDTGPIVLASDASHFYSNMGLGRPYPIVFHLGDMLESWRMAVALTDGDERRVIPGHDPAVLERFEALPGSNGETVQLHLGPRP